MILKVNERLSRKCILLPAQECFAGVPFYANMIDCSWEITGDSRQFPRWDMIAPHYLPPCETDETIGK